MILKQVCRANKIMKNYGRIQAILLEVIEHSSIQFI